MVRQTVNHVRPKLRWRPEEVSHFQQRTIPEDFEFGGALTLFDVRSLDRVILVHHERENRYLAFDRAAAFVLCN